MRHSEFGKIGDIQNNHLNVEKLNLGFSKFESSSPRFWLKHRLGKAIKKPGNDACFMKQVDLVWNTSFWDFLWTSHPQPLQFKNNWFLVAGFQDDPGPLQEALFSHELQADGRTSFPVWPTCSCQRWTLRFESNSERRQFGCTLLRTEVVRFPAQGSIMSEHDKMSSPPQRIELIFLANGHRCTENYILQTLLRLMKMEEGFVPFQSYIGPVRIKQTKTVAHSPA